MGQWVANFRLCSLVLLFWICIPTFVESQGWVISGTVADAAGGPIAGADLDLFSDLAPTTQIIVTGDTTGVDGSFSMVVVEAVAPGAFSLQVDPPPGFLSTTLSINLSGNIDVGIINLGSGWIISGLVQDTLGNPLTPIDIDMRGSNTGWIDLTGDFTNAAGNFALTLPALVDEYRIVFSMATPFPTVFPLQMDNVFLFGDTDMGTIVLSPGFTVTGSVIDDTGAPLAAIDMNATDALGFPADLFNDDTDLNGNFSVLFPAGTWDVSLRSVDPAATQEWVPHTFPLLVVDAPLDLGTTQMFPGYHFFGQVIGSNGLQIEAADFDAEYSATGIPITVNNDTTDLNGDFDILLPQGSILLEIDPPTVGPVRQTVVLPLDVAAGAPVDLGFIVLPDGVLLSGRCIDSMGTPVGFVDVELFDSATGLLYPTIHENGAADGTFSFAIDPGNYDLMLIPPAGSGLSPSFQSGLSVLADTDLGDLVLAAGVQLSGSVTAAGVAQPDVLIEVSDPASGTIPPWGTVITDPLGNYSVSLTPGTYNVNFIAPVATGYDDHLEASLPLFSDLILDIDFASQPPAGVASLLCNPAGSAIELTWSNAEPDYDTIIVFREGVILGTIAGTETQFLDAAPLTGMVAIYEVVATRAGLNSPITTCTVTAPVVFIRCDSSSDGLLTIGDAVTLLNYLFLAGNLSCPDAADCNDSGLINIADPVMLLQYLFVTGTLPPAPFPEAGPDPTGDNLGCS
ncbi:MAG: hypothetical protein VX949_05030 [Planctomycetota bacterium]|nr:hypothetical protein [Planctomycetota bacterium]